MQAEILFQRAPVAALACQQGGRGTTQRRAGLFDRDLTQVGIVHPHLGTVTDQQLAVGLVDLPAEFSGAGKNHHAGGLLRPPAVFGDDNLGKIGA